MNRKDMADTPRTQEMLVKLGFPESTSKFAEHARQLERELNDALERLHKIDSGFKRLYDIEKSFDDELDSEVGP